MEFVDEWKAMPHHFQKRIKMMQKPIDILRRYPLPDSEQSQAQSQAREAEIKERESKNESSF
jgi:hypothetical protein